MKNILLTFTCVLCAFGMLFAQSEYHHSAKVISSGAVWSSNSTYQHFGVAGEPVVSSYISNKEVNGTLGFLYNDNVQTAQPPMPAVLIYPPDNSVLSGTPDEPLAVSFYWVEQSGVNFRIQVAQNKYFSPVFIDTTVDVNYFTANIGSDGLFFWRVQASRGGVEADWSSSWKFNILVTGVDEETSNSILPNPAVNLIYVNVEAGLTGGTLRLFDLFGRERLLMRDIKVNNIVDLKTLEAGVYFLVIEKGKIRLTRKIIKL